MKQRRVELGAPTEYGFTLPILRYKLSKVFFKKTESLLDYGCGNGANTILFKDDIKQINGVEVEKERVEEAISFVKKNKIKNIHYQLYDGNKLPFKNSSFENIISYEVLEHTEDDDEAIKEVHRVLKRGGIVTLTVPNKGYLMETHGFNLPFSKLIKWNRIPFMSWLPDTFYNKYGRARIYSKDKIIKKLEKNGFRVIKHEYIMPPFDKVENKLFNLLLRGLFNGIKNSPLKMIGVSHFIVATK